MEITIHRPEMVVSKLWPMQETRIIPLGDIHYGEKGCNVELLRQTIRQGIELDCYFIGMGDYIDVAPGSNRKALSSIRPDLYDPVIQLMDDGVDKQQRELQRILAPSKGRWLGLLRGNHTWEYGDGTSVESRLAHYLDCPFLGDSGMVVLRMERGHMVADAVILAFHGHGAGNTIAAPLNRLADMAKVFFAHAYLIGHYHKDAQTRLPWSEVHVNKKGQARWVGCNRVLVACGGFLKSYEWGTQNAMGHPAGGYAEKRMMVPVPLGAPLVFLRPIIRHGYVSIDANAIGGI